MCQIDFDCFPALELLRFTGSLCGIILIFYDLSLYLTCPAPSSDCAWLSANLPGLLQDVCQRQRPSCSQGVGEKQVPTLEKRSRIALYSNQKLFTCLGKHHNPVADTVLSYEEENNSLSLRIIKI